MRRMGRPDWRNRGSERRGTGAFYFTTEGNSDSAEPSRESWEFARDGVLSAFYSDTLSSHLGWHAGLPRYHRSAINDSGIVLIWLSSRGSRTTDFRSSTAEEGRHLGIRDFDPLERPFEDASIGHSFLGHCIPTTESPRLGTASETIPARRAWSAWRLDIGDEYEMTSSRKHLERWSAGSGNTTPARQDRL